MDVTGRRGGRQCENNTHAGAHAGGHAGREEEEEGGLPAAEQQVGRKRPLTDPAPWQALQTAVTDAARACRFK